jgi:membrane protease YdiL (CAAX protease family)
MAVVVCIGAPLAEEVVFRGYIYPAMKRFTNISVAVIFTGILFGAVHGNLGALLPLTVLGIILALAYELTGSLWAPIAIHFCFNAATTAIQIIMNLNPELLENLEENAALIGLG